MTNFEKVKKFMKTFGQEIKEKAEFPSDKITKLRVNLIEEELDELKEAIYNKNIKEVADALTIGGLRNLCALRIVCPREKRKVWS